MSTTAFVIVMAVGAWGFICASVLALGVAAAKGERR